MIEKMFKKGITRKLFSVVLVAAMVVALMPMNSLTVHAQSISNVTLIYNVGNQYWYGKNTDWESIFYEIDDNLSGCTFSDRSNGEKLFCDGVKLENNASVSGRIVKIDGDKMYVCTASDHEAKKAANDLCPNCDPDGGSGGGSGSDITWGHFNSRNTEFWYDTAYVNVDDDGCFVGVYCTEHSMNMGEPEDPVLMKIMFYDGMDSEWLEYDPCSHIVFEDPTGVLIPEMTYTITIPATVSAAKEGYNAFGDGITVSGLQNIASDKAGLKVSASSANEWKLVNEDSNEVRYGLRESASSNENVTEFKFAKDNITSESGKTIACGVFINAEDFENAPAGDYTDIITWTVSTYSE